MINNWDELQFWQSGEWQAAQEKIDALEGFEVTEGQLERKFTPRPYCPARENLFAALDATPFNDVKVAIYGQDPYPNRKHATGLAFSVPKGIKAIPPTAYNLLEEYASDLRCEKPRHGDLTKWAKQGVLLWNVIPICEEHKPLSCEHWQEWPFLTDEITRVLSEKGIVFCLLGGRARAYAPLVAKYGSSSSVIEASHPSPRASRSSKAPFFGSRIFTRINAALCEQGKQPIDWRL